jgi:hypothetical protein
MTETFSTTTIREGMVHAATTAVELTSGERTDKPSFQELFDDDPARLSQPQPTPPPESNLQQLSHNSSKYIISNSSSPKRTTKRHLSPAKSTGNTLLTEDLDVLYTTETVPTAPPSASSGPPSSQMINLPEDKAKKPRIH